MIDKLGPADPPGAPEVVLWVGLGILCLLLAVYPSPGKYSVFGGVSVYGRGELTIAGTALAAGFVPALYALGKLSGFHEWFESLSRRRQLAASLLLSLGFGAVFQLVSVPVITVKSVLVGFGSFAILYTVGRVVLAKRGSSGPLGN